MFNLFQWAHWVNCIPIKGASGKTLLRIFHCLPKTAQIMFMEDREHLGQINLTEIIKFQNKILEVIQKLLDAGALA
ncbi:MAG: hypothetical protein K6U80_01125 [Firmicutes bacterium]|nr:hypothetical protein [Bacillota bacterium]